jgi:hypothetical protein
MWIKRAHYVLLLDGCILYFGLEPAGIFTFAQLLNKPSRGSIYTM